MKALGIDYGEKRIGISISDPNQLISLPQEPIFSRGIKNDSITISKMVEDKNIDLILSDNDVSLAKRFLGKEKKIICITGAWLVTKSDENLS